MRFPLFFVTAANLTLLASTSIAALDLDISGRVRFTATESSETFSTTMLTNSFLLEASSQSSQNAGNFATAGFKFNGSVVQLYSNDLPIIPVPGSGTSSGVINTPLSGPEPSASQLAGLGVTLALGSPGKTTNNAFTTDARIDFKASETAQNFSYGSFTRIDFDADTSSISDVDSHIWISSDKWGKIQLGTDIDAKQGVFDTSVIAAGPGYSGTQVKVLGFKALDPITTAGIASYGLGNVAETFDSDGQSESSLVFTSPTWMGFTGKSELDIDGNWARSLNYANQVDGISFSMTGYIDSEHRKAAMLIADVGDLKAAAYAGNDGSGEKYFGGGVKYSLGEFQISADASKSTSNDVLNGELGFAGKETDLFFGTAYKIAPGLILNASYGIENASVKGLTGNTYTNNNTLAGAIGEVSSRKTSLSARMSLDF